MQPLTPPRAVKKISSIVPVVLCQWATFHKAVDARARKHRAPNMNKCHYVCVTYVLLYREILRLPCAGAISKFEVATTSKGKINRHHTRLRFSGPTPWMPPCTQSPNYLVSEPSTISFTDHLFFSDFTARILGGHVSMFCTRLRVEAANVLVSVRKNPE